MAGIKKLAASAARFDAISSLARTDDMLAVIGVIMLLGVLFSSYGAYWQGRLASAQFKNECSADKAEGYLDEKKKNRGFIILVVLAVIIVTALLIYIFRNNKNHAADAVDSILSGEAE